jgi:hypothetical protein
MKHRTPIPPAKELHKFFEYQDGYLYWKVSWHKKALKGIPKRAGYLSRHTGYRGVTLNGVSYAEHRVIWRMHNPRGVMPLLLDHIDGDRTNNKITNLRKVTASENGNNRHSGMAPKVLGSGVLQKILTKRRRRE